MKNILLLAVLLLFSVGFLSAQATYTWIGPNNGSWATATNWSPTRSTPATNDLMIFNSGTTLTIISIPVQTIGRITIANNSNITLNGSGSNNLTISNEAGADLIVEAGSWLNINTITLIVSANGEVVISGTLENNEQLTMANNTVVTNVSGTLINKDGITPNGSTINVLSGAKYVHARNGGNIHPATWDINSTCEITGITNTEIISGTNQSFGNYIWNCTGQTARIKLGAGLGEATPVKGDVTVLNTGSGWVNFTSTDASPTTINGNLFVHGGELGIGYSAGIARTVNVLGNVEVTAGTFNLAKQNANNPGTLNVAGHFKHTGGTITETGSGTGTGTIVFNGSSQQNYTSGGTISNTINFIVNSSAILQMASSSTTVDGAGSFTLSSGGTLGIKSVDGITSSGSTGNIRVSGTRSYNTGGNYIYNGAGGAQVPGNGLPATVNNLTIDNSSGISTNSNLSLNGVLTLTNGIFALTGGAVLTIANTSTEAIAGTYSNSTYLDGSLKRNTLSTSEYLFPVGDNGKYKKAGILPASGTAADFTVEAFDATPCCQASLEPGLHHVSSLEEWEITGTAAAQVKLYWTASSAVDEAYLNDLRVAHYNTSSTQWESKGNTGTDNVDDYILSNSSSAYGRHTFGAISASQPLPVGLLHFRASIEKGIVRAEWTTTSEINNDYFMLEKTTGREGFEEVAEIKGAGNSNTIIAYRAKDESPYKGISYYRLKQVDFDGQYTYSDLVAVNNDWDEPGEFNVFPNPSDGTNLTVGINGYDTDEELLLVFSDLEGKEVVYSKVLFTDDTGALVTSMDTGKRLSAGVYLMTCYSKNGTCSRKVVIR